MEMKKIYDHKKIDQVWQTEDKTNQSKARVHKC